MKEDTQVQSTAEETITNQAVSSAPEVNNSNHKKGNHKKLKITLSVLAVLIILPVMFLGWLGFVPGLSTILGATKARDLGVQYTQVDYDSYIKKTNTNLQDITAAPPNPDKPGKLIIFADPKTYSNLNVTQEELTAAINEIDWLWMPIKNAQVKLSDGVVEVSGNLNTQYANEFISFIGGVGYSESDVDKAVSYAQKFAADAPIYLKATASVKNDTLSFQLENIKVGRFNVPMDIADTVLSTGTTNAILNTQNLVATAANPVDGAMLFTGELPTTIYVKSE